MRPSNHPHIAADDAPSLLPALMPASRLPNILVAASRSPSGIANIPSVNASPTAKSSVSERAVSSESDAVGSAVRATAGCWVARRLPHHRRQSDKQPRNAGFPCRSHQRRTRPPSTSAGGFVAASRAPSLPPGFAGPVSAGVENPAAARRWSTARVRNVASNRARQSSAARLGNWESYARPAGNRPAPQRRSNTPDFPVGRPVAGLPKPILT